MKTWLEANCDRLIIVACAVLIACCVFAVLGCDQPQRGTDVNVTVDGGTPINVHAEVPPIIVNAPPPPVRVVVPATVVDSDTRVRVRTPWAKVNVN